VHADRWNNLDPDLAGSSLLTALKKGDAVPELNVLALAGPSDLRMKEIIDRSHCVAPMQSNGEISIFICHP
jgi:hypothetical protein